MKKTLPSTQSRFTGVTLLIKLLFFVFAALFVCSDLFANTKLFYNPEYKPKNNPVFETDALMVKSPAALSGPTISYVSPQTWLIGTTVTLTPTSSGVAAPGYSSSFHLVGTGFHAPAGVAVDAAGNVYVADEGDVAAKKVLGSKGSTVTLNSSFSAPSGIAVDASGNVY